MVGLFEILFLFALGCILGWIIEIIYRSIQLKKLVNPGFLSGPYLPIYGNGILILYIISSLNFVFWIKLLFFFVLLTLLELIAGIIFISYYNIKLWDYSKNGLNYKGLICFKFSFYWFLLALGFYFYIYPLINKMFNIISFSYVSIFFLGIFYGVFLLDLWSTLGIAEKIRKSLIIINKNSKSKFRINYYLFREHITVGFFKKSHKHFVRKFFIPLQNLKSVRLLKDLEKFLKKRN